MVLSLSFWLRFPRRHEVNVGVPLRSVLQVAGRFRLLGGSDGKLTCISPVMKYCVSLLATSMWMQNVCKPSKGDNTWHCLWRSWRSRIWMMDLFWLALSSSWGGAWTALVYFRPIWGAVDEWCIRTISFQVGRWSSLGSSIIKAVLMLVATTRSFSKAPFWRFVGIVECCASYCTLPCFLEYHNELMLCCLESWRL